MKRIIKEAINERLLKIASSHYKGLKISFNNSSVLTINSIEGIKMMGFSFIYVIVQPANGKSDCTSIAFVEDLEETFGIDGDLISGFIQRHDFDEKKWFADHLPKDPWKNENVTISVAQVFLGLDTLTFTLKANAKGTLAVSDPLMQETILPALQALATQVKYPKLTFITRSYGGYSISFRK